MKHSIFKTHTSIHLQLPSETHIGFRTELFKKQLTIQEALGEFARLIAEGDKKAHHMLDELVVRKIQDQIEGIRKSDSSLGELDKDTVYSMIHGEKDDDQEDQ